tara:strand:- start:891 stop:1124 length:234 start_codon:yes stop_codon:yes gene_type:complete
MKRKTNPLSFIDIMDDDFYKYIREYEQEKQFDFNIFDEIAFNNYIENFNDKQDDDTYSFYDDEEELTDIETESETDD